MERGLVFFVFLILLLGLGSALTWRASGADTAELGNNGNFSVVGNVSTTNYGFFGWLGNLISRIKGLFVKDINFERAINSSNGKVNISGVSGNAGFFGNVSLGQKLEFSSGNKIEDNSTCIRIYGATATLNIC